jgi:hypothetical protein
MHSSEARHSSMMPVRTITLLFVVAVCVPAARYFRRRAEAGRRRLTAEEFDAAYKKSAHTSSSTYTPAGLRASRLEFACTLIAWLALVGAWLSLRHR